MPHKDPEKRRQYQREYRKNNREKLAKYEAEYRKNNRKKRAKQNAEYRKNNREKLAKYEAEYRKNNQENIAKKKAEYYKNNQENIAKKKAEYYKNNQERIVKKLWFRRYGGTEEQYNHYLSTTHCECCGVELTTREGSRKPKLTDKHQDHCHDTGEIRAVICNSCNRIEGLAKVKERLELMLQYCKKYNIKKENPNGLQRS